MFVGNNLFCLVSMLISSKYGFTILLRGKKVYLLWKKMGWNLTRVTASFSNVKFFFFAPSVDVSTQSGCQTWFCIFSGPSVTFVSDRMWRADTRSHVPFNSVTFHFKKPIYWKITHLFVASLRFFLFQILWNRLIILLRQKLASWTERDRCTHCQLCDNINIY